MMTNHDATVILADALECLEEYHGYGEAMRAYGRGFHPCGKTGDTVEGVIARVGMLLAQKEAA